MSLLTSYPIVGNAYVYQNVFKIPEYCIELAVLLDKQTLFEGRGSCVKECKVISLIDHVDSKICAIFSDNAREILGNERAWHINCFGFGSHRLITSQGEWLDYGVTLWLYDKGTPCSIDELEKTYNQVLEKVIIGWSSAIAEENPDIIHGENPEEFSLFIKESTLFDEAILIRFLATKFSMTGDIKCHRLNRTEANNDKIYLWIRKSEFENVIGKFGFKFT